MADLYRKSSLEKISSPEQLDKAITVSSPMSWLALIGVALIFAAVIIGSFVWSVPETIKSEAIITDIKDAEVLQGVSGEDKSGKVLICYVPVEEAAKIKSYSNGFVTFKPDGSIIISKTDKSKKGETSQYVTMNFHNEMNENPDIIKEGPFYWRGRYAAFSCYPVNTELGKGTIVETDIETGSSTKLISLIFRGLGEK
ncbi:MAG: hypothetical protein IKS39_06235 [Clostridia bacterium]|nr:hypothetical protein [Clostridia bacterium]